jgi:phospholipid transport system substrate-binding protein
MPTRRFLLLAALAVPAIAGPAQADASADATTFIRKFAQDFVGIVNGPEPLADKQKAVATIIDRDVDVVGVAQFCLGRFWRIATPAERKDYLALFHQVLVKNITGKLGDYAGVSVSIGHAQPREGALAVSSVVTTPNMAPANVQWLVSDVGGSPKVIDLIAEGTSLRLTQRSDYTSYLDSHGDKVAVLIDALRRQAANKPG